MVYAIRFDVQGSTYAPELKSVARAIVYISQGLLPLQNASALFSARVGSPCTSEVYHPQKNKSRVIQSASRPWFIFLWSVWKSAVYPNRPRQERNIITFCALLPGRALAENYSKGRKGRKTGQGGFALSRHFFRPLLLLSVKKLYQGIIIFTRVIQSAYAPLQKL